MRITIFLFIIVMALSSCSRNTPQTEPKPNTEPSVSLPKFNGTASYAALRAQTDFGPRTPLSKGHDACLAYLTTELGKYAETVAKQPFTEKGYDGETLPLTNVFASFNKQASKRVLLLAHWDTRPRADQDPLESNRSKPILGANDGASGVAVLLELARTMKQNPPPVGVDILLVDGEDYGKSSDLEKYFLGAKFFAKHMPSGYKPLFGILLDMIGDADLRIPMEQNSMTFAPAVVGMVWSAAQELGITQFVSVPGDQIEDDHLALNQAGIPTIDLIDFQYPYWHTVADTPDKCSAESLEAVGRVLVNVIYTKAGK
ncbi:MAG TPA: M28 family peptidase [Bacteroidota bacterium]|nr:M28 family peptidase [Bacteroidota bacterium]